jgi:glycopeptide antibiotics resistance protein
MKSRLITASVLIAYSAILINVLVFKNVPVIRIGSMMLNFGGSQEGPANLVPFKTILPYLLGEKGWLIACLNLLGNIVVLVPIGFLVPFVYRHMTWKKSIALAVATGLVIEGMQALLRVGIFDIDDVILNGLGVIAGYRTFTIFIKMSRRVKTIAIITIAVIVVAGSAAVYSIVGNKIVRRPESIESVTEKVHSDSDDNREAKTPQGDDPCRGTGGTGQIIALAKNTITIKSRAGSNEIIQLTDQTVIVNSAGTVSKSDLKIGDRVTVVIPSNSDGTKTASHIFICNEANPKRAK